MNHRNPMLKKVDSPDKNYPDSPALLRRLYALRRGQLPPMGSRSVPVMAIAVILTLALMSVILSLSWVQRSELDYLRNSSGVHILENLDWTVSGDAIPQDSPPLTVPFINLASIPVTGDFLLTTEIPVKDIVDVRGGTPSEPVVLALPGFDFIRARVETTWTPPREYVQGEALILPFFVPKTGLTATQYKIIIHITPTPTQKNVLRSSVNQVPLFLAGFIRYKKYEDFSAARRVGSGKQLADIGRIVLAIFSVMLFIFIDSSPECFALGLFMSLKAFGVVAAQRWFSDTLLPAGLVPLLPPFLLSFADFMQLYFFTQLARLFRPRPLHWLAAGVVFGILYTWGTTIEPTLGGTNWGKEVWRWRNLVIGVGCLSCALPVAWLCWRDKNFHRTAALLIASSGVIVQIVTPAIIDIPGVSDMLWYRTWYNLFEAHTPYVFALSTFINVSTLEQRVKSLTGVAVQSSLIEREMSLGREVQKALFRMPELPDGIKMAFSHEAALYVSGDVVFGHHDPNSRTATAILCDVTGHGVQAALKASICSALCESIWEGSRLRPEDDPSKRLDIFYRRALGFFSRTQGSNEVLAMVGCEVSMDLRKVTVYRANAVLPLMISRPNTTSPWNATVITSPAGRTFDVALPEPAPQGIASSAPKDPVFFALFSDGLIDTSRIYKALLVWLAPRLESQNQWSAASMKDLILSFPDWNETHDDRTLCVIEVMT